MRQVWIQTNTEMMRSGGWVTEVPEYSEVGKAKSFSKNSASGVVTTVTHTEHPVTGGILARMFWF